MVSKIYEESIIDAKKARDAGEYLMAVRILKGAKSYIHEPEPFNQASDFETKIDIEYEKKMNHVMKVARDMTDQIKAKWYEMQETEMQQDMYASQYLKFYHKLSTQNDL